MATLDNSDFTVMRNHIRRTPDLRETFRGVTWTKQVWKDTMQAAEDWFVNGFTATPTESFKAALEVEAGAMSNAEAKLVARAWMAWRFPQDI